MDLIDVKLVGSKVGNGLNSGFVSVEPLNQGDADNHFFTGGGQFFQIFQYARGAAIGPLFKRRVGDMF